MPLQEFLQHGVYKLPHQALPDGAPRPAVDKFMRTMGREPPGVPYVITSKAPDIKSNDWRARCGRVCVRADLAIQRLAVQGKIPTRQLPLSQWVPAGIPSCALVLQTLLLCLCHE